MTPQPVDPHPLEMPDPPEHAHELDARTLAAIDLWQVQAHGEAMPLHVTERCRAAIGRAMSDGSPRAHGDNVRMAADFGSGSKATGASGRRWAKPAAIVALAACAAAAALGLYVTNQPSDIERRDAFIAENADTIIAPLRLAEPGAFDCGELAWSPSRREIYILATGMVPNDPEQHRYALWASTPQGEVEVARFDITDPNAQVLAVPAVAVAQASRFSITLEAVRPGIEPASVPVATSDAL